MKNEHFSSLLFSTQETTSNKSNFEQFPSSKIIFKKISFVRSFPLHQDEILIKPKNITTKYNAISSHKLMIKQLNPLSYYTKPSEKQSDV